LPKEDAVWLTKEQMSILFNRDRSVISRHINSIYEEGNWIEVLLCIFCTEVMLIMNILKLVLQGINY
jgi:hypothetical protein